MGQVAVILRCLSELAAAPGAERVEDDPVAVALDLAPRVGPVSSVSRTAG